MQVRQVGGVAHLQLRYGDHESGAGSGHQLQDGHLRLLTHFDQEPGEDGQTVRVGPMHHHDGFGRRSGRHGDPDRSGSESPVQDGEGVRFSGQRPQLDLLGVGRGQALDRDGPIRPVGLRDLTVVGFDQGDPRSERSDDRVRQPGLPGLGRFAGGSGRRRRPDAVALEIQSIYLAVAPLLQLARR